jgi:hypothetical protein
METRRRRRRRKRKEEEEEEEGGGREGRKFQRRKVVTINDKSAPCLCLCVCVRARSCARAHTRVCVKNNQHAQHAHQGIKA